MNNEDRGTVKHAPLTGALIACLLFACSDSTDQGAETEAAGSGSTSTSANTGIGNAPASAGNVAIGGSDSPTTSRGPLSGTGGSPMAPTRTITAGASAGMSAIPASGSAAITSSAGAAGNAAGTGGSAGEMSTAGTGSEMPVDLGEGDGSDVITLGDSWMAGIAPALQRVSGQSYRNYSAGGAPLLEGGAGRGNIPAQYMAAKMENADIKSVVLTAGGIDLTQGSAGEDNEAVRTALEELFAEFGADGVKDIVYFSYSRGSSESVQNTFIAMQTEVCAAVTPARCHFIDSDTIIDRMLADGIHPTSQGSTALAEAAYKLMMEAASAAEAAKRLLHCTRTRS